MKRQSEQIIVILKAVNKMCESIKNMTDKEFAKRRDSILEDMKNNLINASKEAEGKKNMATKRTIPAFELYFRKNGEKRSVLLNSKSEVTKFKNKLRKNKRKFLGVRSIELSEVK